MSFFTFYTNDGSDVLINETEVKAIKFVKPVESDNIKSSERRVLLTFRDGQKAEFICHRNLLKALLDKFYPVTNQDAE